MIIKLRDALRIYLFLKNSIRRRSSTDFGRELQAFDQAIQPGVQAIRDREANRPYCNRDLQRILGFTKRYQTLSQARSIRCSESSNGKTENDRWWHMSDALLSAIASGSVAYPAIVYGDLISAYRTGDAPGFNRIIQQYNQYLARTIPGEWSRPRLEFFFNQASG